MVMSVTLLRRRARGRRSASTRRHGTVPWLGQPVADARLSQNDRRLGRVRLDLLSQLSNIDPQILRVALMGGTPHGVQHLFVGHNLAGVPRKKSQEFELLRREPYLFAVAANAAARDVDLQSVDPDDRGLAGALHSVAERRAQPSHELPDPKRLVDEIVGAAVKSGNLLRFA